MTVGSEVIAVDVEEESVEIEVWAIAVGIASAVELVAVD